MKGHITFGKSEGYRCGRDQTFDRMQEGHNFLAELAKTLRSNSIKPSAKMCLSTVAVMSAAMTYLFLVNLTDILLGSNASECALP